MTAACSCPHEHCNSCGPFSLLDSSYSRVVVALQRYIGRLRQLLESAGGDQASPAGQEIDALVTMRVLF